MLQFDYLVVGSGIGGLGFALKAAETGTVAVVCKAAATATNTSMAQGGLSAVTTFPDSADQHVKDTLVAGAGLCNKRMVELLATEAPACIAELLALGVNFTRTPSGTLDLGREGGHRYNRIIHTHDHTGHSIQQALLQAVQQHPNIFIFENHFAVDLLLEEEKHAEKRCVGIQVLNIEEEKSFLIAAKAVMLATGGVGQLYQHTTNPAVATGDGIAMAARAGAVVKDMEFIQFHPTALYDPGKPTFLISEAVRGFGAELKRPDGTSFMHLYHPQGSLAPRDVVARAIHTEMQQANSPFVYLDLRHLPAHEIRERFPKIYNRCLSSNLDLTSDLVPVVPAAHYICGGIRTNSFGCTSIRGLYACGEAACTGIHGANRLASNSLPEAWIFGRRAAGHAASFIHKEVLAFTFDQFSEIQFKNDTSFSCIIQAQKVLLQQWMWQYTGIVRTTSGLLCCLQQLEQLKTEAKQLLHATAPAVPLLELVNMTEVALLVVTAALNRSKSVGCHYIETAASGADTFIVQDALPKQAV
ncbi:MAG: L-aspartate oxidase [Hymenobacteraceae bacterium]|nr:L-aspartate oxidase [Hymenobacteraceae bacterium]MDX5396452.1 L-aspartate oxidase [Hymenobacteraceae bacterium]MDX5442566.1 L-aspartate oxidase [Hymenobacteraceae bacterium]MDX5512513.1 L-aspartate oxidase [Hymenobacteraceae bacterium]